MTIERVSTLGAGPATPDPSPGGMAVLRRLVAPHRWRIVMVALTSLGSALLEALFIVLLTALGMAVVGHAERVGPAFGHHLSFGAAFVVAAVALVARVGLGLWGVELASTLTAQVTTEQRLRLSRAFLRTSWAIQQDEPSGRLQELLTSFVTRINLAVSALNQVVVATLSLLAFLGTGLSLDPISTSAVLAALAVVGGILTPLRRAIQRRSARNARAGLAFANSVAELGTLGQEMQVFGVESRFEERIDEMNHGATATLLRTQVMQGAVPVLYVSLAYAAVLAGVGAVAAAGFSNLGAVSAVILLMLRSLNYGQQLSTGSATLSASLPFLEQVDQTERRYAASRRSGGRVAPASATPLTMRGVGYAYTEERPALSGVDVDVQPGEALGVIGPSGAGKSTLAQLVLGLRAPTEGTLSVAGEPLDHVDRAWWARRVAFVAQEARLYTGTVAENIRFFRDDISDAGLREAARRANVLADIEALPDGFDTHLGERASQLSGGQRQRLSIARALAGSPELLVLDEPTSALDGQSETLIRDTLAALKGRLSIVIIAHRMSTLEMCDRIMVIEAGRMTALGTPAGLRNDSSFYRNALSAAGMA